MKTGIRIRLENHNSPFRSLHKFQIYKVTIHMKYTTQISDTQLPGEKYELPMRPKAE